MFHQIHHSPQRIEVITSFYKHPVEMIVNSIIGSLLVYAFLGLSPEAGAVYTLCTALGEFFYHTSVRTPRWVGWFSQRAFDGAFQAAGAAAALVAALAAGTSTAAGAGAFACGFGAAASGGLACQACTSQLMPQPNQGLPERAGRGGQYEDVMRSILSVADTRKIHRMSQPAADVIKLTYALSKMINWRA